MIKVITFDLDDTLWAINPVIDKANQRMLDWMNSHAPKFSQTYNHQGIDQLREEIVANKPHLKNDLSQIRVALIQLGLSRCGYEASERLAQQAFDVYFSARNDVDLFAGTEAQLSALKKTYQIGALTNGNADLEQVGIDHLFDFYFNSAQIGVSKPHPDFFTKALEHTGLSAECFIHIGDHPQHDIAGAQTMGMRTIWMNPEQKSWPSDQRRPCEEIQHLDQLSAAVANIHGH
ncbi:MAG: HAD family hydrolase [Gammaproteobacteria bacterium]|nr:HAD family hydrolase [Gammaproteobacteria bacterium]